MTVREYIEKFFEVFPSKIKRCIHSWNLDKKVLVSLSNEMITFTVYGNSWCMDTIGLGLQKHDDFLLKLKRDCDLNERFNRLKEPKSRINDSQNEDFTFIPEIEDYNDEDDDDESFEGILKKVSTDAIADAINFLGNNLIIGYNPENPKVSNRSQSSS
jgi:hypothetical protein